MEKEKMTIHRALAELKLLESKINKTAAGMTPVGIMQINKPVNGTIDLKEFEKEAQSKFQSVMDLIQRREDIKKAVVRANADTKVLVAGKEMTVSDAISYKTTNNLLQTLATDLERIYRRTMEEIEKRNEIVNQNAISLAGNALQKDNVKIGDKDAIAITEPYKKVNDYHLVDPLEIKKKFESMRDEAEAFASEVDAVLSEINAVTFITI